MDNLIKAIITKDYITAKSLIIEKVKPLVEAKILEIKNQIAEEYLNRETDEVLTEAPRVKIIKARVRKGKVQRRKRVSNIKGYVLRKRQGSKLPGLVKMSPQERRHRRMGARKGKYKRKRKMSQIRMKTKRSLRKRLSLGLKRLNHAAKKEGKKQMTAHHRIA